MRDFLRRKLIARYARIAFVTLLVVSSLLGQNAAPKRPTSQPYTGDLSIFETPGRDERLQINRVMDVLGIAPGKSVADIGAGSGGLRCGPRAGLPEPAPLQTALRQMALL